MTVDESTPCCRRCDREGESAFFDCPERLSGNCPYQSRIDGPYLKMGIFILPFAAFMTTWIIIMVRNEASWLGTAFVVLAGIIPICAGLYFLARRRVTLHSTSQGVMWQQQSLLGVNCWRRVVSRQEVLNLEVGLSKEFVFPPSVASAANYSPQATGKPKNDVLAANVVEAALLGLLSQGELEVHQANIFTTTRDRGDGYSRNSTAPNCVAYLISPSYAESHPTIEGTLEGRILELVRSWPTYSHAQGSAPSPTKFPLEREPRAIREMRACNESFEPYWPLAPTIYLLVWSIFEEYRTSPSSWLLDLVRKDGVTRSLFTRRQRGWMRAAFYEPVPLSVDALIAEGVTLRVWWERVAQQQPEFASALEKEIRDAIRSRKTSGD